MKSNHPLPGAARVAPTHEVAAGQGASLRNLLICIPLLFATLLPFVALAGGLEARLEWQWILLGALGWWLALILRLPLILALKDKPPERSKTPIILASGPAEELVRLGLLLWLGMNLDTAFSLALGWAGLEVVYAIVQGFALVQLSRRHDDKAEEAKALLRLQGMDQALQASAPFWGIAERFSANAIHLAFTLLLLASPFLVVLTAPLHSGMNLLFMRMLRRSLPATQLALMALAALLLLLSLWLAL